MLAYLKITEDKLIDMFSTRTIIRKIKDVNYNGYVHDKLRKELNSRDIHHAEAIFDSVKFKKQEKPQKIKILTLKLLTRRPILLAQIKAGNNANKLKQEIRQTLYLLYQHNKVTKKLYNNLIKPLQ